MAVGMSNTARDLLETHQKSFKFVRTLGNGRYGEVWEGLWNTSKPVAIKTLNPEISWDLRQCFLTEVQIMKKLRHSNLIQLYAACTTEEPIYLITELMENGSLLEFLQGKGRSLKLPQLIDIAVQIASGMIHLGSLSIIHRDLAARNVSVGNNNVVKIADFGLARILREDGKNKGYMGNRFNIRWTAPEAVCYSKFSTKSDVWSFGIFLTELITYGQIPYPGMTNEEILDKVDHHGYRMPAPPDCPPALYAIMLATWYEDPFKRPCFETLRCKLENVLTIENAKPSAKSRNKCIYL